MIKNHLIKFYVDEDQFNRIRHNASSKGFMSISAYFRDLALNQDMNAWRLLIEIHKEVVKIGKKD